MSEAAIIAIIQAAIKFGPEIGIAIAKLFKPTATIDDAIAALEAAQAKSAQDYLNEAKSNTPANA